MTPARQIDPGMIFYVTVRCVNRSYRFVPQGHVSEVIRYCLAVILERYRERNDLELYEFEFMSNHYHLLGRDISGCLPNFVRDLNSLLTRALNALRGISGKNIEEGYGLVRLIDDQRIFEMAVYTQANPVASFLVAKARDWRGVSSRDMSYGVPVPVERPQIGLWAGKHAHVDREASQRSKRAGYAGRSKLPQVAHLVIDRPPIMQDLTDEELRARVGQQLAEREVQIAEQREQEGLKVLGWRRAQQVHFLALPRPEEMFARNPTYAASAIEERTWLARLRRAFLLAYGKARDAFLQGNRDVVFPQGTWLMRCRFGVRCEALPV